MEYKALEMETDTFTNIDELEDALLNDIKSSLSDAIKKRGEATLLLSGGSTPINLYKKLSSVQLEWNKVIIGLVDERYVPTTSEHSNEKMIRETLYKGKVENSKLIGMVYYANDSAKNLEHVINKYETHFSTIDFCLLGMGGDGHTASLFPDDPASEKSLNGNSEKIVITTIAPNYPERRITCSFDFLKKSKNISLMITGKEKTTLLENKERKPLPIDYFRKSLNIYCTK